MNDVYRALREHLDSLPAGFPATSSGVEIRILKRLFNPAERCIGCGLCVSTCPSGALVLERKSRGAQPEVPKNTMEAHALRLKARAKAKADLNDKLLRHKNA
jgi:ferredoxin